MYTCWLVKEKKTEINDNDFEDQLNHDYQKLCPVGWCGSSDAGALGSAEYPFIAIAPRSTLARRGST